MVETQLYYLAGSDLVSFDMQLLIFYTTEQALFAIRNYGINHYYLGKPMTSYGYCKMSCKVYISFYKKNTLLIYNL